MTKEQFEYKLNSIEIRQTELEQELDKVISIIKGNEPFDEDRIKQLYNDTLTNLNHLRDEFRQLYKDFRNLN